MEEEKLSARELLESIQRKYLALKGLDKPVRVKLDEGPYADMLRQLLGKDDISVEASWVEAELDSVVLSTEYQDPYTYHTLFRIVQDIEKIKGEVLEDAGLNVEMPYFGTVEHMAFSAEVCSSQCSEKLILISNGLFTFAHLMAKVVALALPIVEEGERLGFSTKEEDIQRNLEEHPEGKLRFFDLMLACLMTNAPPSARQYLVENRLNMLVNIVRDSFEIFVVAHEYAHAALGHLDDKNIHKTAGLEDIAADDLKQIFHSWEEELEADLCGAALTLRVMGERGIEPYMAMLGIIVCTNSFELFEKIEMLRSGDPEQRKVSRSHPPGLLREKLLEKEIFEDRETVLFETVDAVFGHLWEEFVDFFLKIKAFTEQKLKMSIYDIPFGVLQNVLYHIFGADG